MMTYLQLLGLVVLVFFCVYVVVDRICKCVEQCKMAKAFEKYAKMATKTEDLEWIFGCFGCYLLVTGDKKVVTIGNSYDFDS